MHKRILAFCLLPLLATLVQAQGTPVTGIDIPWASAQRQALLVLSTQNSEDVNDDVALAAQQARIRAAGISEIGIPLVASAANQFLAQHAATQLSLQNGSTTFVVAQSQDATNTSNAMAQLESNLSPADSTAFDTFTDNLRNATYMSTGSTTGQVTISHVFEAPVEAPPTTVSFDDYNFTDFSVEAPCTATSTSTMALTGGNVISTVGLANLGNVTSLGLGGDGRWWATDSSNIVREFAAGDSSNTDLSPAWNLLPASAQSGRLKEVNVAVSGYAVGVDPSFHLWTFDFTNNVWVADNGIAQHAVISDKGTIVAWNGDSLVYVKKVGQTNYTSYTYSGNVHSVSIIQHVSNATNRLGEQLFVTVGSTTTVRDLNSNATFNRASTGITGTLTALRVGKYGSAVAMNSAGAVFYASNFYNTGAFTPVSGITAKLVAIGQNNDVLIYTTANVLKRYLPNSVSLATAVRTTSGYVWNTQKNGMSNESPALTFDEQTTESASHTCAGIIYVDLPTTVVKRKVFAAYTKAISTATTPVGSRVTTWPVRTTLYLWPARPNCANTTDPAMYINIVEDANRWSGWYVFGACEQVDTESGGIISRSHPWCPAPHIAIGTLSVTPSNWCTYRSWGILP